MSRRRRPPSEPRGAIASWPEHVLAAAREAAGPSRAVDVHVTCPRRATGGHGADHNGDWIGGCWKYSDADEYGFDGQLVRNELTEQVRWVCDANGCTFDQQLRLDRLRVFLDWLARRDDIRTYEVEATTLDCLLSHPETWELGVPVLGRVNTWTHFRDRLG